MSIDGSWRPHPSPTPLTEHFWDATGREELLLQRCRTCGTALYYPRMSCTHCGSRDLDWERASGRGTVYSYTVARRATHPAFADRVPYVIAIIALEEGPRMTSNVLCDPEEARVGMKVRLAFEDLGDGHKLPVFEPAAE